MSQLLSYSISFLILTSISSLAQSPPIQALTRSLGPFDLNGQKFSVTLHIQQIRTGNAVPDPDFQETLSKLEIKDDQGNIHFSEDIPVSETEDESFIETTSVSAELLRGKQASGLLLTYGILPSTPLGGLSWQVLGLFNSKLVPFSKPIFLEGDLVNAPAADQSIPTAQEPNLQGEVLHFRVWTGNFFMIFPVKIDWLQAKLSPAWICRKLTASGPQPLCRYRVEADRVPQEEDETFVRLFSEPGEDAGNPAHIVVRKASQIEFLESEAEVYWEEDDQGIGVSASDDPWLKVRIDGKEGWIHTQEDFAAIGLPQAG